MDDARRDTGSPGEGLGMRTLRGMGWASGSYVGGRLLTLVSVAILARLLSPADFGLVALALIFVSLLDHLADLGVTQALIIAGDREVYDLAETASVVNVVVGAVLAGATAALGPFAADLFGEPELAAIMPALGLMFLIRSVGATHYALAQRSMDFRARTFGELTDVVLRGVVGVGLALSGSGAWSLVLGALAGTLGLTVVLLATVGWRPRLRPRRAHLRSLLRFGGAVTGVNVLWAVVVNVDYLMVGRFLGTAALGLYTIAFRIPELVIQNVAVVAGRVLFPAFAAVERPGLGEAFLASLRYTLLAGAPVAVGLAVLAEPVVVVAFGEQWRPAAAAMQALTLFSLSVAVAIPAGTAFKATGRVGLLLWFSVPRAILAVAVVLLVVERGIVAVAVGQAAVVLAVEVVAMTVAARLLEVRTRRVAATFVVPLAAGAGMAAAMLGATALVSSDPARLLVGALVGAAVYGGLLRLLAAREVARVLDLLRSRRRTRSADASVDNRLSAAPAKGGTGIAGDSAPISQPGVMSDEPGSP